MNKSLISLITTLIFALQSTMVFAIPVHNQQNTSIKTDGLLKIEGVKESIVVDIPEGDFKDTVLELTKDPKYTWINELEGRDDVDWQEVSLAFDEWDYAHEGLSPAGAAIIVIVVTIYTAGAASTLATALTQSAVLQASIAAGVVSIASTAAVSLANNKGNLGKVLKELGSEETIRSVATAMVTAGVVQGLSDTELMQTLGEGGNELGGGVGSGVGSVGSWSADFVRDLVNQAIGATINTAINGGNLGDQLQSALLSAIANTAGEQGANLLHNQPQLLNKLGHALLGCATQSIQNKDCASGAVGAVAGEIAAESMRDDILNDPSLNGLTGADYINQITALTDQVTERAGLIGATLGFIGGLDPNAAAETARNAAKNNGLGVILVGALLAAEVADKGMMAYDAYELTEALNAGDEARAEELAEGLVLALALDLAGIPGSSALAKLITKFPALKKIMPDSLWAKISVDKTRISVDDKLARYLLNLDHPVGGSKAKWFREALGFTQANADDLAKQLRFDATSAVEIVATEYGTKFNQVINILGANGRTIPVKTIWIRGNDEIIRLVTAIPRN